MYCRVRVAKMSEPPRAPESVASEGSDAYFSSSTAMPSSGGTTAAAASVSGGGGRATFAFAEILETARSSTFDDLGALLESIAEARQQQQQQAAVQATTTEAEAEEEAAPKQPLPPPPLPLPLPPLPRPRFVAVHPSCASHALKAKKEKKEKKKGNRFLPLLRLPSLPLSPLSLSSPQLQLFLQAAVAVGLSSCFVLVDAVAFRQACSAVGFALIITLIGSSSSAVGSRLISCASFVLPLLLGAVGGGVAGSLAWEVAGVSVVESYARAKEPQFTIALVGFNLFVLALASAWRCVVGKVFFFFFHFSSWSSKKGEKKKRKTHPDLVALSGAEKKLSPPPSPGSPSPLLTPSARASSSPCPAAASPRPRPRRRHWDPKSRKLEGPQLRQRATRTGSAWCSRRSPREGSACSLRCWRRCSCCRRWPRPRSRGPSPSA